jgi:replication factor C subunit 3/5
MNESLSMTEPAKDAVIKLANGDMRRILNILQAASTACSGVISDDLIYSVTATPHPADLDRIFHTLLDQTDFTSAISTINQLKLSRGLALVDILLAMFDRVAEISIPDDMRIFLTRQLAEIEYRLSHGAMDAIQLSAIVGAFFASRTLLGKSL